MIIGPGEAFTEPEETWEITRALAFIDIGERKILHQLFVSSTGRTAWKAVPEISYEFATTGKT